MGEEGEKWLFQEAETVKVPPPGRNGRKIAPRRMSGGGRVKRGSLSVQGAGRGPVVLLKDIGEAVGGTDGPLQGHIAHGEAVRPHRHRLAQQGEAMPPEAAWPPTCRLANCWKHRI